MATNHEVGSSNLSGRSIFIGFLSALGTRVVPNEVNRHKLIVVFALKWLAVVKSTAVDSSKQQIREEAQVPIKML